MTAGFSWIGIVLVSAGYTIAGLLVTSNPFPLLVLAFLRDAIVLFLAVILLIVSLRKASGKRARRKREQPPLERSLISNETSSESAQND